MSFSWVDPHFAALYARREEERLAERLATRMREPALCEPDPTASAGRPQPRRHEEDVALRRHLKLL